MSTSFGRYSPLADKENQPPEPDGSKGLVDSLTKLSVGTRDGEALPEAHVEEDPTVLAERAHHMRFIGEALDMVSRTVNDGGYIADVLRHAWHYEQMKHPSGACWSVTAPSSPRA